MAIKLFRKGTTHNVNGIECEIRLFDVKNGQSFIGIDGWCANVEDLEKKEDLGFIAKAKEMLDRPSESSSQDVRGMAKEAGIEGWDKKRITTLKGELDGEGE